VPAQRSARLSLSTYDQGTLHHYLYQLRAPAEIAFLIAWGAGENDSGALNVDKFEINYGDGTGWIDVTADAGSWDYLTESDPDGMTHYVYEQAGTYEVLARATFWDGEVVYSNVDHDLYPNGFPVTVLPPP
jgi:hypothetical protein